MITRTMSLAALALLCSSTAGLSQQPPPVRQIGAVAAVSRDSLTSVSAAVEVAGGRVFVNDILARRVLLYDSMLTNPVVVADSDGTAGEAYGGRPGTLLPFRGDSAMLITPASLSMLVLNPEGRVARVMAMPPSGAGGLPALIGSIFGTPGFDARGRLVFFSPSRIVFQGRPAEHGPISLEPPDSALLVRFDFSARQLDTVGAIRIPRTRSTMVRDDNGRPRMSMTAFPPTTVDDWAVTSDGRLAIVRGRDYHVDWLDADDAWTATPRMTYGWARIDDDQKTALIDSVAAALQTLMDSMPARTQRQAGPGGPGGAAGDGRSAAGPGGGGGMTIVISTGPGGPGGGHDGPGGGGGGGPTTTTMNMAVPTVVKAAPTDVPDYRPAFGQGSVRADQEGNLWIRTGTIADGRPVYDVVNAQGRVIDRVQLPPFRTIAGFGRGVVYLGVRDSAGVMHLERARVR